MHRRSRVFSTQAEAFGGVLQAKDEVSDGLQQLKRMCKTEMDLTVFTTFFDFNIHILKTNFYRPGKTSLAFRLEPSFLSPSAYPEKPFGVFMMIGAEFRGFHVRFRDVARGGVRLVQSRYQQAYSQNVVNLFDECYNLASTQQRKNKDIPEGGSKGVILLGLNNQNKGSVAFRKYISGMLDLLLPDGNVVDHYGDEEFVFLGPDEGTADFMDWASLHARERGYPYWKAFTTGKTVARGGIPHDMYGMTTRSVRGYITGIQSMLDLDGKSCTKMQTGGPDGDLGSNEIKLGHERTVAIVDGSGVLVDPKGIHREELVRLAGIRKPIKEFDVSLLSKEGYRVLIEDKDVTLPDGFVVESGLEFRNTFHLMGSRVSGDFFVPCGGRPAAVNADNWQDFLFDEQRRPRFQYVVEGANLFFTQEARLKLEDAGLVVIKDASANKGGVTSSSLEVMAAMSLTDEEFDKMMAVKGDTPPEFYSTYVAEVQRIIELNAKLEFECLWRHKQQTGGYMCHATDRLSTKITTLRDSIGQSEVLWGNEDLRNKVLRAAVPKTLQKAVTVDQLQERLPETYLRALFASYLSSRFVYSYGMDTSEFALFEYVQLWLTGKIQA